MLRACIATTTPQSEARILAVVPINLARGITMLGYLFLLQYIKRQSTLAHIAPEAE
jgi:hypothetical protein